MSTAVHDGRICPYLGLADDAQTSLAFPSAWNTCHRHQPGVVPSLHHQTEFCLVEQHVQCPVYLNQQATLPRHQRSVTQTPKARSSPLLALLGGLILIVVLGGLGWTFLSPGAFLSTPTSTLTFTPRPTRTSTFTPTFTFTAIPTFTRTPSLTPTLGTVTASFTPTRTASFTPTATLTRTATFTPSATFTRTPSKTVTPSHTPSQTQILSKHSLEVQIGSKYPFLIHKVRVGENMNQYAEKYQTSVASIVLVNHSLKTPLWVDTLVVIPVGFTDVKDLPSFDAYMVTEEQSVEALAKELGVSPADLSLYNAIAAGDLLQTGDWILVPYPRVET
jgi:LysM repeat protein